MTKGEKFADRRTHSKKTFDDILDQIRRESKNKVELGNKFEKITKSFLETDIQYRKRFEKVELWNEWEYNDGPDTGIDLMATQRDGSWCAIQCKCYKDDGSLDLDSISTFFAKVSSFEKKFEKSIYTILVYTGDYITPHADKVIIDHKCHKIEQENFRDSSIIWDDFPKLIAKKPKLLKQHQINALNDVISGLNTCDRGKMIMACGTGKTLTSLRIAEKYAGNGKTILYLVPSISLIHQTMREWSENALIDHYYSVVCSDKSVGEEGSITELAFPPTTDVKSLKEQFLKKPINTMNIIFSTYHSIEVVSKAMQGKKFDLVLCDEAHRTTGVEDASYFTKIHDEKNISAKKRIYMTATPRVYSEAMKNGKHEVHSMDDPNTYGQELHYYSFSDAVEDKELTDFKVRIPIIPEEDLEQYIHEGIDGENDDGTIDERVLLAAIWHGLNYDDKEQTALLQRVIAFTNKIEASKQFSGVYNGRNPTLDEINYNKSIQKDEDEGRIIQNRSFINTVKKYEDNKEKRTGNIVSVRHVDGKMRAHVRNVKMRWLKESDYKLNECRILSNARCLSEGVDVPDLDGVIFLHPRKSKVDVIQSVGRVMRKAEGKKWGYVILPVIIPAGRSVGESLLENKPWRAVWQVLVALRSHNPNFANEINRISLETGDGGNPPLMKNVEIIWMGSLSTQSEPESFGKVVTKMVEKVGERTYFEDRAEKLGEKAHDIQGIIQIAYDSKNSKIIKTVSDLCNVLRSIVNDTVNEKATIQVMAQHHTLSQIFQVLFEKEFKSDNPIANVLNDAIENIGLKNELEKFNEFYEEVKKEAETFKTIGGKQAYIKRIYGNFLKGFDKKNQQAHGVVYTPDELINFIIYSVEDILKTEFNTRFNRSNVKVFDPFTGTGAFITKLLESRLIQSNRLENKFKQDLYVNEILLLSYYVAAVNIESVFKQICPSKPQITFSNINYTDTFTHNPRYRLDKQYRQETIKFGSNIKKIHDKIKKSKWSHIHVIMSNPPYSAKQANFNDQNPNIKYIDLDDRIKKTYERRVKAKLGGAGKSSLRDSYIRAFRWASDRIGNSGIIAFVTNASFIRSNIAGGIRACFGEEFTDIWCFDLRGNQNTQGEMSRREGGKIFGSKSKAPVAITILIKNPNKKKHEIHYKDIGDNLSRDQKLDIIVKAKSIKGISDWKSITLDKHQDWIDKRRNDLSDYYPIGSNAVKSGNSDYAIFKLFSNGVKTHRDAWIYNSSKEELSKNMKKHIDYCNDQDLSNPIIDPKQGKWDKDFSKRLKNNTPKFEEDKIRSSLYRPFFKQYTYFDKTFHGGGHIMQDFFPKNYSKNLTICVPYRSNKQFSVFITDITPDLQIVSNGQYFPFYRYENKADKKENILDTTLMTFKECYKDNSITKKEIFYYVYAMLHHSQYRKKFANNLLRELPFIPFAPNFKLFAKAGNQLINLHLNFETGKKYPLGRPNVKFSNLEKATLIKIKKDDKQISKTILKINKNEIFDNIPIINYTVNGRTPLEWIIDRYRLRTDKDSEIIKNPCKGMTQSKIIAMIKRVIFIGIESDKIISKLSKEDFESKDLKVKKTGFF